MVDLWPREGLANATFGSDRIGVVTSNLDPSRPQIENITSIYSAIEEALSKYGPPKFLLYGWQDYGGPDIARLIKNLPNIKRPVCIEFGEFNPATDDCDVAIDQDLGRSGKKSDKVIYLDIASTIITPELLQIKKSQLQLVVPFDTNTEDFLTVVVGGVHCGRWE